MKIAHALVWLCIGWGCPHHHELHHRAVLQVATHVAPAPGAIAPSSSSTSATSTPATPAEPEQPFDSDGNSNEGVEVGALTPSEETEGGE